MNLPVSRGETVGHWPDQWQRVLLEAAARRDQRAIDAWEAWAARFGTASNDKSVTAIFPAVYVNLSALNYSGPGMRELRSAYQQTWMTNQLRNRGLTDLLQSLQAASVDSIPLKGISLALFYYGDLGARRMGDVDLLVRPSELGQVSRVLAANGWNSEDEIPPAHLMPFIHAMGWRHPKWGALDLHWMPFTVDCSAAATAAFWKRAKRKDLNEASMLVPSTTDMLVHMCFHSRKPDRQAICRWVLDLLMLLDSRDDEVEWAELVDRARHYGMVAPVRDALAYVRREFEANVPDAIIEQLAEIETTDRDRRRYQQLSRPSRRGSVGRMISTHWWRYSAGCACEKRKRNPVGFVRYVLAYGRLRYRCRSVPQILKGLLSSRPGSERHPASTSETKEVSAKTPG